METRQEQLHREVTGRLARVRATLSDDEFAALVARVVTVQLRFENHATPTTRELAALAGRPRPPEPR